MFLKEKKNFRFYIKGLCDQKIMALLIHLICLKSLFHVVKTPRLYAFSLLSSLSKKGCDIISSFLN